MRPLRTIHDAVIGNKMRMGISPGGVLEGRDLIRIELKGFGMLMEIHVPAEELKAIITYIEEG